MRVAERPRQLLKVLKSPLFVTTRNYLTDSSESGEIKPKSQEQVSRIMRQLAALHEPDQVAGGGSVRTLKALATGV